MSSKPTRRIRPVSLETATHPELDGTTLAVSRLVLAERYRAARDAEVLNGFWQLHRLRVLLLVPATIAVVTSLRLAGLEPWRVLTIACSFGASVVLQSALGSPFVSAAIALANATVATALTGGAASPFVVLFLSVPASAIVSLGRGRQAVAIVALTGLLLGVVALEPSSWAGAGLARPYDVVITVIIVGVGLAILVRAVLNVSDANLRAHEQIDLLREETLNHLCERARGLQSIGAKVAHELKNPLAAVKGLVQLMARGPRDERDRERIGVVGAEIARMEDILREYLSYSRPLQDLRPVEVELGELAQEVIETLSGRSEAAGVTMRARGDATVNADPRRLKEALVNLVQNAIEACAPGAAVDLDVRELDDRVEIVIADGGAGIAPETLARIGTPFFTTRANGTGLGVVLARSAVVHHGGNLSFDSTLGRGTRVTVRLPRRAEDRLNGKNLARG
jgi:two-component system, NtrC family, sensor histidine kinase HydH